MNIRPQLEKKIENKRQEIADLEGKLREASAFLQGLQEALRMLPKEGNGEEKPPDQVLRAGSNMAKARDYLRKMGKPMHVAEILKGIGTEVDKKNKVSLSGSLGTYARRRIIFTSQGANVFGLIEFENKDTLHSEPDPLDEFNSEPPDGFGMEVEIDDHPEE
jgi:hypothetical protein